MHEDNLDLWQHDHGFGQEKKRPGEARTIIVIAVTGVMMVVEIAAGIVYGSMALLADGLHMASHAAALSISAFAYIYARRHAHDERYSFGTGKVNALGGFTGAVLLAVFALMMASESVLRLVYPVTIAFNQAIFVAIVGLVVNGASVFILGHKHEHGHDHEGDHEPHEEHDDGHEHEEHEHSHSGHRHDRHHHDHNLRAAYLHVLADALTSVLAILALLAGKYYGLNWMDPLMGIVGAMLVARWSMGLLHTTGAVLLDRQGPKLLRDAVQRRIEANGDDRVADLHLWSIGPNIYAVELTIVTHDPQPPDHYKRLLPDGLGLAHVSVEVHECVHDEASDQGGAGRAKFSQAER
jgi:cation diffusion facilitator family transporter